MLEKNPEKRIKNATQVVEEIKFNMKQSVPDNYAEQRSTKKEAKNRFNKMKLFVPVVALFVVLIIIYFFNFGKNFNEQLTYQPQSIKSDSSRNNTPLQIFDKDSSQSRLPQNSFEENLSKTNSVMNSETDMDTTVQNERDVHNNANESFMTETTFFIETWPWCRVYLNYVFIDETQMNKPKNVKPGKYLLSLQNPNYPTWSDSIEIYSNQLNTFKLNLDSIFLKLTLEVSPWGDVYIDDKQIGTTPIKPIYLTRKNHSILIKNDFYETWQDSLLWNGENQIDKKIKLKKLN